MGPVGVQEMIVIFLVALVLFGPKKLPELGKTIGKAITEFRRAQSELKATFDHHMRELEKESESIKEVTRSYTTDLYNSYDSSNYYDESGAYNTGSHESTAAASPTTVSEPATQGADTQVPHETAPSGTVARGSQTGESPDTHPNGQPATEAHPVNS